MVVIRKTTAQRSSRLPPTRDRKSTRLNSSHGYISYAVFCLKKKKDALRSDRDRLRSSGGQRTDPILQGCLERRARLPARQHLLDSVRRQHTVSINPRIVGWH